MPTLGTPLSPELLQPGSVWALSTAVNGYARVTGTGLATQAATGRRFEVLSPLDQGRVHVRLQEDGYPCWLDVADVIGHATASPQWRPRLLDSASITARLPGVLDWVAAAAAQDNAYLWGGSLGPNLDC